MFLLFEEQKQSKYTLIINKEAFMHIRNIMKKFIYYKWSFQRFVTFSFWRKRRTILISLIYSSTIIIRTSI